MSVSNRRVLLLIGGQGTHKQPVHYAELASLLAGEGGADLRITDDLRVLNPATLAEFGIVANYTAGMEPSVEQVAALLGSVERGQSFLGLHVATATFRNTPDYLAMVGAKFVRHDPIRHFTVTIDDAEHPMEDRPT